MSHETPPDDPGTDPGAQSDDTGLPSVTRRAALGLLGLGVLAGGESTAVQGDVGGGPDSNELAHLVRPVYEGPESELPDPGVTGRRFTVTDTGGTYSQFTELRDTGSAWEPITFGAGSLNTDKLRGIADHIIKDKSDLEDVFPAADGETSILDDGDTVFIDPDQPPIRHERDIYIDFENAVGVSVFGRYRNGEQFELKPADESEAQGFVVDSRGVTIEGISYDGNAGNQSHNNSMPFVRCKFAPNFSAGYNYAQNLYPENTHGGQGDMFIVVGGNDNLRGYFNRCDNPGDRMWTIFRSHDVVLVGERMTNGFDRMITFSGVENATAVGCVSRGNIEGSAFGVTDNGTNAAKNIQLIGCHGIDMRRAFCTIRQTDDANVDGVTILGGYGKQTSGDSDRYAIETVEFGGQTVDNVSVYGGEYHDFTGGGVLNDGDNVSVWGTHFENVGDPLLSGGTAGDFFTVDGGTDFDARGITWDGVTTLVDGWASATRPRWDGVIGGGPFGGVDLSTVAGRQDGDRAIADGTSAAADDALAIWDADGSAWDYFDPTGSV